MKKNYEIVEPFIDESGYECVMLENARGVLEKVPVHRLVAETFVPNPDHKKYIRHKDGNKLNNRADNLEWVDTL